MTYDFSPVTAALNRISAQVSRTTRVKLLNEDSVLLYSDLAADDLVRNLNAIATWLSNLENSLNSGSTAPPPPFP